MPMFLNIYYKDEKEWREAKHNYDLEKNPKRHDFSESFYLQHEMIGKCIKCADKNKSNFNYDPITDAFYRK